MRAATLLLAIVLATLSISRAALADDPYLFDLLKEPAYRGAWDAMLKGEKNVPKWIVTFSKTYDGVASPATPIDVAGKSDLITSVCKPHDCGDNQLYVLFAPDGAKAWGMLVEGGDQTRWFGGPSDAEQTALRSGPNM